jgi:uncharacterized lipoprotein YmbA
LNRRRPWIAAVLLFAAGCASGPGRRTYVLTPPAGWAAGPVSDPGQPRVQLQPVFLPDYLDSTDVLLRRGPHELKASQTARWGERLSKGLTDALSAALAARLGQDFMAYDQGEESSARQILVDVASCDLWPDGHCVLTASWTVLEKETHRVIGSDRAVFEIPAKDQGAVDDTALVAALARAVDELADRLAAGAATAARSDLPSEKLR